MTAITIPPAAHLTRAHDVPRRNAEGGLRPELAAAAGYLGLRERDLRARLLAGGTLRELARERGRPLERLVQTMVDVGRAQLQAAVVAGMLTQAQLEDIVRDLRDRIVDSADCALPFPPVPVSRTTVSSAG
jgi:hypothetical protein